MSILPPLSDAKAMPAVAGRIFSAAVHWLPKSADDALVRFLTVLRDGDRAKLLGVPSADPAVVVPAAVHAAARSGVTCLKRMAAKPERAPEFERLDVVVVMRRALLHPGTATEPPVPAVYATHILFTPAAGMLGPRIVKLVKHTVKQALWAASLLTNDGRKYLPPDPKLLFSARPQAAPLVDPATISQPAHRVVGVDEGLVMGALCALGAARPFTKPKTALIVNEGRVAPGGNHTITPDVGKIAVTATPDGWFRSVTLRMQKGSFGHAELDAVCTVLCGHTPVLE